MFLKRHFKSSKLAYPFVLVGLFAFIIPLSTEAIDPIYYNFSLTYPISELGPNPGDIIVRNRYSGDFSLASREDSPDVFGIVSPDAALVFRTDDEAVPLMRFGQTPVNVILKNGDIEIGDIITTSGITGHGQVIEDHHKYAVGFALESLTEDEATEFVTDYDGEVYPAGQVTVDLRISFYGSAVIDTPETELPPGELYDIGIRDMISADFGIFRGLRERLVEGAQEVLETEAGYFFSVVLSIGGILAGIWSFLVAIFLNPLMVFEIFALPFRIWTLFLSLFGIERRSRPWGVVYDSVTKQPIDPAYVVIEDEKGNEVKMSITDIDGRYGFLVEPGRYRVKANKTNYIFPSEKLKGKKSDILYNNLYFGELFDVEGNSIVVDKNIPMDPENFDWNEFTKLNKNILTYYSYTDLFKAVIFKWLFYAGFVVSVIAALITSQIYSWIILGLYVPLFILRLTNFKLRSYGSVLEKDTGKPFSFAVVRVCLAKSGREISSTVCDIRGRYFALVNNGEYYVKIEKKTDEGDYRTVLVSDVFEIKKGVINRTFEV